MTDKQTIDLSNNGIESNPAIQEERELNSYEQKQLAKKERYLEIAKRKRAQSAEASQRSIDMVSVIPMGQPILVGHHSERAHRALLKRSDNVMRKSCDLDKTAKYYEEKAEGVGNGGISSDDPQAIRKLEEKLQSLKNNHVMMKEANKVIRSKKKNYSHDQKVIDLMAIGFSEKLANKLFVPDFCGRVGFATYALTNNNANIKQVEGRITELKRLQNRQAVEEKNDYFEYKEDKEDNRILFHFAIKPPEEIRKVLKRNGFVCSPSRNYAWVRKITSNALHAGNRARKELMTIYEAKDENNS